MLKVAHSLLEQRLGHIMSPRNALRLRHGHDWEFVRENRTSDRGGLVRNHAEMSVGFEAVLNSDLAAFRGAIESLVEQFAGPIARRAYETVSRAASEVGNVVSATESGSIPAAFLRMIETIELGVDDDGRVSMPSIHAAPENVDKMLRELTAQGPEFERKVEEIKAQKVREALEREAARLGRYRGRSPA